MAIDSKLTEKENEIVKVRIKSAIKYFAFLTNLDQIIVKYYN